MLKAILLIATSQNQQARNLAVEQAAKRFLPRLLAKQIPDEVALNR